MGLLLFLLTGCVLAPRGTREERDRAKQAGRAYETPFDRRDLPQIPDHADWRDLLHRAFLANGDLEAAYFDWRAALARIDQAAAYPNSNLAVSYMYMFSKERLKTWDRNTFGFGFDPAMNLQLPVKVAQAGKVALEDARAAGYRFLGAKFDLQRKVLIAYLDLALMDEKIRIQRDNVELLRILSQAAANRVQAGGPQQDLLKVQIEHRLAENELANMELEARSMRAMLNGMLAREPREPLVLPATLPAPRAAPADDSRLIAMGVSQNPQLAAFARQVQGRRDALDLARMRYLPDLNPQFAFTGSLSQSVGAMLMLPTNLPEIRGMISEARAVLQATAAMHRQAGYDRSAEFISALLQMRNAERQVELFQRQILPSVQQALASSRQSYAAGSIAFADLIDSQRTLLNVRTLIAEARIAREKRLAELEALAGVDVEALGSSRSSEVAAPTTRPGGR